MSTREYSDFVRMNWHRRRVAESSSTLLSYGELRQLFIMSMGIAGESGEVAELLKKYVRDGKLDSRKLLLELGDVLHYMTKIGQSFDITLDQIMVANQRKLESRHEVGKDEILELDIARTVLDTSDFKQPKLPVQYDIDIGDTYDHNRE